MRMVSILIVIFLTLTAMNLATNLVASTGTLAVTTTSYVPSNWIPQSTVLANDAGIQLVSNATTSSPGSGGGGGGPG